MPMCRLIYFNLLMRALIIAVLVLVCAALVFRPEKSKAASPVHRAVLVELFTAEGCSSCPPADALLGHLRQDLARDGIEVIPLGFHVDYWNSLGWKDRFSSSEYTHRQEQYELTLGLEGPYTPQMIVDGITEFVGSNTIQAHQAIMQAATRSNTAEITILPDSSDRLLITAKLPPHSGNVELLLAVTEDNLTTKVGAGENNGRELHHSAVVRDFTHVAEFSSETYKATVRRAIPAEWKRDNLRAVAFIQQGVNGKILCAASVPLANAVGKPR